MARLATAALTVALVGAVATVAPAATAGPDVAVCHSTAATATEPGTFETKTVGVAECSAWDGAVVTARAAKGASGAFAHGDGAGTRITASASGDGAYAWSVVVGPRNIVRVTAWGTNANSFVDMTAFDNVVSSTARGDSTFARVMLETEGDIRLSGCRVKAVNEDLQYNPGNPC